MGSRLGQSKKSGLIFPLVPPPPKEAEKCVQVLRVTRAHPALSPLFFQPSRRSQSRAQPQPEQTVPQRLGLGLSESVFTRPADGMNATEEHQEMHALTREVSPSRLAGEAFLGTRSGRAKPRPGRERGSAVSIVGADPVFHISPHPVVAAMDSEGCLSV